MTSLQSLTSSLGTLLILLGIASFFGAGMTSLTPLIPSFFGVFFAIFGVLGRKESLLPKMLQAALGVAVLGALVAVSGVYDLILMFTGSDIAQPPAVYGKVAMFFMCIMYIVVSVRKRKKAAEDQEN